MNILFRSLTDHQQDALYMTGVAMILLAIAVVGSFLVFHSTAILGLGCILFIGGAILILTFLKESR